ncbi:hypothetical protein C8Q76DRAFT_394762 [Earliella scabrosa]|nr:hypothetical protein C8Q76DRAFT_394762 [Earliella scabrosa]
MATVIDVSSRLGEYMLKGWVLTDRICSTCAKVPLMRSPSSATTETHFCANCDSAPPTANAANSSTARPPRPAAPKASISQDLHSVSSTSISSSLSRSSTPPTEVSHAPSSPLLVPVMDTAELLRRRHQSDTASAEIGKRMLKGWAMLADECPGPDCYGIPLVRPPKTGTAIDPRKECVICGIVYVDETDAFGQYRLVPMQAAPSPADTYRPPVGSTVGPSSSMPGFIDKGKARAYPEIPSQPLHRGHQPEPKGAPAPSHSSTLSALEATARSLEQSLGALSGRLNSYATASIVDPVSIGQTADAIAKVSEALSKVKALLWDEHQALLS